MSAVLKAVPPTPQKCHACENVFAGSVCNVCKAERPAFTALKRITARAHHGVQPLRDPKFCRYYPAQLCGCSGSGDCLEAA